MIPEAAVIAAAEAVYGGTMDGSIQREAWLKDFRAALEAAAPFMLAEARESGYMQALAEICAVRPTGEPKPYEPTK